MERYQEYKDSGEQWLGEIPSHWEVKRLGSYFNERKSKVSDKDYAPLSVTKKGILPQLENVAKSNDSDNRKQVCAGDFVINSRSDRKGSSGVSLLEGSVSLINIVLQPRKSIYSPFCNYLLKSNAFIEEYYRNGRGIVADLWTTRYDEMKSIKLAMPPLSEQAAIVTYLDRVTAQIDKAIAQQQRMIDLLNERKQIIIQHAVTKGLDPNAEMVDSGVEWIGKIPKGWKLYKLKHLLQDPLKYGANESASEYNETDPRYIRITDIDNEGNLKNNTVCTIPLHKALPYMLQKGDLLLARSGATVGKSYLFQEDYKACYAGYLIKACFSKKISPQFVYLYTQSASYSKWKDYILIQSTIQNISAEKYANLLIPTPPVEVQLSILKYLDPQLDKMNVTLANFNRKIEVLRERKQIIINEVVTGKVKVS